MSIICRTNCKQNVFIVIRKSSHSPQKIHLFLNVEGHFMKTKNRCTRTFGSHESLETLFSKKKEEAVCSLLHTCTTIKASHSWLSLYTYNLYAYLSRDVTQYIPFTSQKSEISFLKNGSVH